MQKIKSVVWSESRKTNANKEMQILEVRGRAMILLTPEFSKVQKVGHNIQNSNKTELKL